MKYISRGPCQRSGKKKECQTFLTALQITSAVCTYCHISIVTEQHFFTRTYLYIPANYHRRFCVYEVRTLKNTAVLHMVCGVD